MMKLKLSFTSIFVLSLIALAVPKLGNTQTTNLPKSQFNTSCDRAIIPIRELQGWAGVTISGRVTSIVGNDFIVEDETGNVIVDAGPRWWQPVNLSVGEFIKVIGEMDDGEFDAFSITREDGTLIQIRPAQGPPPWAGGNRNRDR